MQNNSIAPPGLVLQLRSGTPQELIASISAALATTTPVKRVTHIPDGCVCLSVQLPRPPAEASPASSADGVLHATAQLEHNAQVTPELLALLRQHGLLSDADDVQSLSHGAAPTTSTPAARPLSAAALSPAGPLGPQQRERPGSIATGASLDTSLAAAAPGSHPASTQQQHLIPLLQRCGLLMSVNPEHDAAVLSALQRKVWSRLLAPVSDFRQYFGDQVGFYLAYLNALTCWLVAPTVTSTFLLWALRRTGATGLSSPLVPVTVLFQLLWSAAGVKLWRQHQALLRRQWRQQWHNSLPAGGPAFTEGSTSTVNASSAATNNTASPVGSVSAVSGGAAVGGNVAAGRGETASTPAAAPAAARQASVATSGGHFTGAVPQWAAEAPTATGTRTEFAGSWQRNARGQWLLRAPLLQQLLRVAASTLATSSLLGLAAAVLVACLNLQGLITPMSLLFMPRLAALSLPGGPLAAGLLKQVPMVTRVLAVSLFDAFVFGPVARALTSFENRRTVEGWDASLTVKKAALQFLFTFAPVVYVGLAGAGAAAAANDAAGYFRFELLRRIVLEFGMPWASLLLAQRRRARSKGRAHSNASSRASDSSTLVQESSGRPAEFPAASEGAVAGRSAGSGGGGGGAAAVSGLSALQQTITPGVDDAAKPAFDTFTGCWDVTRDMGYVMLFASILPWAAPLTLLYTLAKIKQDCMALLLVYQRPMPRQMRNLGSWNTVLLVQVLLSVVTNVFLSGLSSGQLAQLLPGWLVPEALTHSLTAAAAARPADSTAASKLVLSASDWPPSPFAALNTGANLGRVSVPGSCPAPQLFDAVSTAAGPGGRVCPAWYGPVRQPAVVHMGTPLVHVLGQQAAGVSTASTTATSHLLLLFCIEHLLLLLVVLVMVMVPDEPAGQGHTRRRSEMQQPPADVPLRQEIAGSPHGEAVGGVEDQQQQFVVQQQQRVVVPVVRVHGNPLFSASTAHKSGDGV